MARVIIVSNRLPVSVKKVGGKLRFYPSSGGLAQGLESYTKDKNNKWVGWPGIVSDDLSDDEIATITRKLDERNCYPVFLTQKQLNGFYNGYSNSVIWPLFHGLRVDLRNQDKRWSAYKYVNQLFAEVVLGLSTPETTIWVHDYQLLLMPQMLRQERPDELVGFFLHIPFPPAKTFKRLSQGSALLKGMLGSDLVGFHTSAYVQDFLDSCKMKHVGKTSDGTIKIGKREVHTTDFPLGIDYDKFADAGMSRKVEKHVRTKRRKFGRRKKIILTVDRLDPSKGLVERLEAYRELLRKNPRLHKKVVMVMLVIPSRTGVRAYDQLKERLEKTIENINADYGKRRWQPVHYFYQTVPFEELAALYRVSHVAFIAPKKDGMNLVAKEYIASRSDRRGVLILSETAGAAKELEKALLVNPKAPDSLVEALTQALTFKPSDFQERVEHMRQQLANNTVYNWKNAFMESLQSSNSGQQMRTKHLSGNSLKKMFEDFQVAKHPVILLDYDGVITHFKRKPHLAKPSTQTINLLTALCKNVDDVFIISGRSRQDMEAWLGKLRVTLVAEHGAFIRSHTSKTWRKAVSTPSNWKKIVKPVLEKYVAKTPGSFVEEKEYSLVWHHRASPPFYAQKYATILRRVLPPLLKPMDLAVYRGNMVIEIKSPNANKGVAARNFLKAQHDFILAFGDDYTDEDIFAVLPDHAYSVKVGRGQTFAKYRVKSVDQVRYVLRKLTKLK